MMGFHKNSMINALLDLFPNIGLDRRRFLHQGERRGERRGEEKRGEEGRGRGASTEGAK